MSSSAGSSNPKGAKVMDVDTLLRDLRIREEEFDDLIIGEEVCIDEEPDLLAVARVLTDKSFNAAAFEDTMRFAWSLAKKAVFRDVGNSTFIIQFTCLGDWKKVVEEGPWLFRNWGIVIKAYDGYSKPSSLVLDRLPIWVQIHDVPEAYVKQTEIIKSLSSRVGKFVKVDTEGATGGNFVRVRVELDVNKPLARFTSVIRKGEREVYLVKFEKIPKFCEVCGIMGHEYLECGTGYHAPEARVYGEWMIAEPVRRGRGRANNFPPRGGGRYGQGRGRGAHTQWKANSTSEDTEEEDPLKTEKEKLTRRRLELLEDPQGANHTAVPGHNRGALVIHEKADTEMLEGAGNLESPIKTQDKKRMKKGEEQEDAANTNISAGPLEGYCREQ
ncbi:hypothetical protein QYE76_068815 [Lolium multiflorum]|uniref:DUF4283 domain-containing protein n=1 Tax=Lolium multiflorum TaxID=4521 RepID=A0AAD8SF49_LOLMU|nr:hypothetical protein QYE76_068815 [Lolium multiflorum]